MISRRHTVMKKVPCLLVVLVFFAVIPAGCGKMEGTYSCNQEANVAIEFKSDGTFVSLYRGQRVKGGKYKKKGNSISLTTDDGYTMNGTLDGDTLTINHEYSGTKTYTKK
jgi:hypothetical protein